MDARCHQDNLSAVNVYETWILSDEGQKENKNSIIMIMINELVLASIKGDRSVTTKIIDV